MTTLDYTIIIIYLCAIVILCLFLGKGIKTKEDYYVGGRNLPWWAIGLSTMATQSGAISFISIPAFVAIRQNGGLTWLQYELAIPIAIIFVSIFFIPFFRKLKLLSIYEYLENRFGVSTRYLLSAVFLLSRGLGTAITLYASALVLSVCLEISLSLCILIIAIVTILYDAIAGIKGVVFSDVIQMIMIFAGLIFCFIYLSDLTGGFLQALDNFPKERLTSTESSIGIMDNHEMPFWAFLIGGIFLYVSYYGLDQSQAQRELSSENVDCSRKSLLLNAFCRFPLTLLYVGIGILAYSIYQSYPEIQNAVAGSKPDYLIPQIIVSVLPEGLRAILIAAFLAAAMSSLDSALNSLSLVTMNDFVSKITNINQKYQLLVDKTITIMWGIILTAFAFFVENISQTVIEAINKVGSAFYGPILGAFLIGVLSKRTKSLGVNIGILIGVGFNLYLWIADINIHWMWWNCFGTVITVLIAYTIGLFELLPKTEIIEKYTLIGSDFLTEERKRFKIYAILLAYFILILTITLNISKI